MWRMDKKTVGLSGSFKGNTTPKSFVKNPKKHNAKCIKPTMIFKNMNYNLYIKFKL